MASSRNKSRNRGKRPTATIDLKAKDVSAQTGAGKVDTGKSSPGTKNATNQVGPAATPSKKAAPTPDTAKSSGTAAKPADQAAKSSTTPAGGHAFAAKPASATVGAKPEPARHKTAGTASKSADPKAKTQAPSPRSTSKDGSPERKNSSGQDRGGLRSTITHLAAGGLGGVLAMFGASQFAGQIPGITPDTGSAPAAISVALESRLGALEKGAAESGTATIPDELKARIAALESLGQKLTGLTEAQTKLTGETSALSSKIKELADPSGGGTVELRRRLDTMEGTISSLAKAAEGADSTAIPQLAALAGRMNDLRTEIEAKLIATQKSAADDVEKRFAAVDTTLKTRAEARKQDRAGSEEAMETLKGGNQRLSLAMETARAEAAGFSKQLTALKSAAAQVTGSVDGLEKTTSELAARLDNFESATAKNIAALPSQGDISSAVASVAKKLSIVEEKVGAVLEREAGRANSAKQIVLALELTNLRRALDQGRPVTAEIERIKSSAPDGLDLTPLDKLTASKVPSREELISDFRAVASEVVRAEAVDENASAFDKLFANARSIVRVRRTGDVKGDTTEAIVARAEDDLQRSDIKSAVMELKTLTGKAAEGVAGWMTKARDRLSVDAVLEQIEAGLKTSVASSATN